MTAAQFVLSALTQTMTLLVALVPLLVPTMPLWLPLLAGHIKDARHRQAFEAVSRAALLSLNEALQEYRAAREKAQDPKSPGGTAILDEEEKAALAAGVAVGVKWLESNHLLDRVISVYGGEDAVRQALEEFIRHKIPPAYATLTLSVPEPTPSVTTTTAAPVVA